MCVFCFQSLIQRLSAAATIEIWGRRLNVHVVRESHLVIQPWALALVGVNRSATVSGCPWREPGVGKTRQFAGVVLVVIDGCLGSQYFLLGFEYHYFWYGEGADLNKKMTHEIL